jgi:hypothetical protein
VTNWFWPGTAPLCTLYSRFCSRYNARLTSLRLKRQCHDIFASGFFH